jgi:hypothetical protein
VDAAGPAARAVVAQGVAVPAVDDAAGAPAWEALASAP